MVALACTASRIAPGGEIVSVRTVVGLAALASMSASACAGAGPSEQRAASVSSSVSASVPSAGSLGMPDTVTFQADVAPIRALALTSDGFVWAGSERGLRRVRLPAGPAEWIGQEAGLPGRAVSALATDRSGRLLVATEAEVGYLVEVDGRPRYQAVAKLPHVTHLASRLPIRLPAGPANGLGTAAGSVASPDARDGIWAGTPTGGFLIEGTNVHPIPTPRGLAVTSLEVEADGRSAWVGVSRHGLFHVDLRAVIGVFGPDSASPLDFVDSVGTATLSNGTRLAVGRGANGGTRLVLLRASGPELLTAALDLPVRQIVDRAVDAPTGSGTPLLIAGSPGTPAVYRLEATERGELLEQGAVRFIPARRGLQEIRIVAHPDARRAPPQITVLARGDAGWQDVFAGTSLLGVARLSAGAPAYLPGGELAFGARSLSVSCLQLERCVFATGTGPGWIWDGGDHAIRPIPDEAIGGGLMALAGDGRSTVYFVAAGVGKSLRLAQLSSDGGQWEPLMELPVQVEGTPVVTFAALSPAGSMWMAVRDHSPSGQEVGRGVIELQLPGGRAIHHRPYRAGEPRAPEAIPIAGDVAAVRFQPGRKPGEPMAIWFCSSLGIQRFAGGQLSQWGEEDGLDSENCHDLELASDGTVWAATDGGATWFDGKGWRRFGSSGAPTSGHEVVAWPTDRDGDAIGARALVRSGEILWAATARGVWPLGPAGLPTTGRAVAGSIDHNSGLIDDDVFDLAADRYGRVWMLGQIGLTIRKPLRRPSGY